MKQVLVIVLSVMLAACGSTPTTPQQTIYQVTANYNAAAQIIIAYKALPPCPAATFLCSEANIVDKLKQADNVAYEALKAAEATARTPGAGANAATALVAANEAVAALTAISSILTTK